jgi:hypothetical protein
MGPSFLSPPVGDWIKQYRMGATYPTPSQLSYEAPIPVPDPEIIWIALLSIEPNFLF